MLLSNQMILISVRHNETLSTVMLSFSMSRYLSQCMLKHHTESDSEFQGANDLFTRPKIAEKSVFYFATKVNMLRVALHSFLEKRLLLKNVDYFVCNCYGC